MPDAAAPTPPSPLGTYSLAWPIVILSNSTHHCFEADVQYCTCLFGSWSSILHVDLHFCDKKSPICLQRVSSYEGSRGRILHTGLYLLNFVTRLLGSIFLDVPPFACRSMAASCSPVPIRCGARRNSKMGVEITIPVGRAKSRRRD